MTDQPRADVESIVRALHAEFGTDVEIAAISAEVERVFERYCDARVTDFVPVFVLRCARTRLRATPRD